MTKKTGRPKGRPPKSDITKAAQQFNTLRNKQGQDFEFVVYKIFTSGFQPFVGTVMECTPEAVGSTFGGGRFNLQKRFRSTKIAEGDAVLVDVHPSKYAERIFDTSTGVPQGGQGFTTVPPFGAFPGMPGMPPGGYFPPPADDEDDDEIEELRAEIKALKKRDEQREEDRREERHAREMAELRSLLTAQGQPKNNLAEMIEVAKLISGPPKAALDIPQMLAIGTTALTGIMGFAKTIAETKAKDPGDLGQEVIGSLIGLAQKSFATYEAAKPRTVEAPRPQAEAQVVEEKSGPTEAQAEELEKDTMKAFTDLAATLNQNFADGIVPATTAAWLDKQAGAAWDFVKAKIRALPPAALVEFAKGFDKDLADNEPKKEWLKSVAETFQAMRKDDLPSPS